LQYKYTVQSEIRNFRLGSIVSSRVWVWNDWFQVGLAVPQIHLNDGNAANVAVPILRGTSYISQAKVHLECLGITQPTLYGFIEIAT